MTLTMTAVPPTRSQPRTRRLTVRTFLAVLVVIVLLAPVGYLFTRLWTATGTAAATTTAERAAVAYARPVDRLVAVLVDAQFAAVRGTAVDPAAIHAAVEDVNTVDRQSSRDPLQIHQRWAELSHQIDTAMNRNASGPDALRTYAAPISLAQALLDRIVEASKVSLDAGAGSYQLAQVALRDLPEVVVDGGQVSALALTAQDPRLAVAEDRLARAAADVSTGLRAGSDQAATYAVDIELLKPLDEFTAATDALSQTASALEPGGGARDRVDAAYTLVKTKTLALEAAVLDTFDSRLATRAHGYGGERRALVLAGAVAVLAAAVLLWLGIPGRTVPVAAEPPAKPSTVDDGTDARHGQPIAGDAAGPDGSRLFPDLVDARELLPSVGAHRPRGAGQEAVRPR